MESRARTSNLPPTVSAPPTVSVTHTSSALESSNSATGRFCDCDAMRCLRSRGAPKVSASMSSVATAYTRPAWDAWVCVEGAVTDASPSPQTGCECPDFSQELDLAQTTATMRQTGHGPVEQAV